MINILKDEIANLQLKLDNEVLILQNKQIEESKFVEQNKKNLTERVKLNVGGYKYETCSATINQYTGSMLEILISGRFKIDCDDNGYIFIDRDGEIFKIILNSMRYGKLIIPFDFSDYDLLANEVNYYRLPFEVPMLQVGVADLTRRDIVKILNCGNKYNLKGFRLCGLDLSGLFFDINYKFDRCVFDGSNLSGAVFDSSMKYCSFADCVITTKLTFTHQEFGNTRWTNIDFNNIEFNNGNKQIAITFAASTFENCSFENASITGIQFTGCKFINCNMKNALFVSTSFGNMEEGHKKSGSLFADTYIKSIPTEFTNCVWGNTKFRDCFVPRNSNLKGVTGIIQESTPWYTK